MGLFPSRMKYAANVLVNTAGHGAKVADKVKRGA